ncbi:MAG: primosomal protein N' [Clostridiales Family XIII bacterium]|jgi:primosomal protein N' (replication factor Y)|nr:primosomal protein N' [Clostridiales Family XIII bacterium]
MKYADVVIDTKSDNVDNFFTYGVGAFADVFVGARVKVPFGKGAARMQGYVFALRGEMPPELKGKRILNIAEVDEALSLPADAIEVCGWMRARYYCRFIEAAQCFAPAGKPRKRETNSETKGDGSSVLQSKTDEPSPFVSDEPSPFVSSPFVPENAAVFASEAKQSIAAFSKSDIRTPAPPLTQEQKRAVAAVLPALEAKRAEIFLLHGVTGSGKTEVYLAAAEKTLALGRKAIMLVPEISLTHQTVQRFVERFGRARVAILHSKLTQIERYEEWMRIKNGEVDIAVGARSAVFAPFSDIGLIVVDEEHETTYKSDMSPKYDTVEVAVKRAAAAGASVLLGSATPSVVSSYRAEQGLYKKLLLTKRYNTTPLPLLIVADMRDELFKGNKSIFSEELYRSVNETLAGGKQAMLFLNRRGWSSFVSCPSCGYVMKCERCNISLTYHKAENRAVCHYCGLSRMVPDTCPSCGKPGLRFFGLGTEQVEALAKEAFPQASVARLDADNARKRGSGEKILTAFGAGRIDILVGTQMIAKGLDFAGVALVGIVAADISLNIPDFKSPERTFQLITQVAGRAGRREERGRVVVQTYIPENYAIEAAVDHDYEGFYRSELFFRQTLLYPPFSDVVQITSFSADEGKSREGAERVRDGLCAISGLLMAEHILGPRPAPIAMAGSDFRYHLYVKAETKKRRRLERALAQLKQKINTDPAVDYRIIIDVNPYSLM